MREKDDIYLVIDEVDKNRRGSGKEYNLGNKCVFGTKLRLSSSLYENEIAFDSVSSFFEFLKYNVDVLDSKYYITVVEDIDLSVFSDLDFPIRVMNQDLLMREDTYNYKNVVIDSSQVRFDGYMKSMRRCTYSPKKFYIYNLDDKTIQELVLISNNDVELDITISTIEQLMRINELISQVAFKGKVKITISDNFFDVNDNRKILTDEDCRKYLGLVDNKRMELSFRNNEFKKFDDLFNSYQIASFVKSKIPANATDLEKIVFVTDFIIHYMKYDVVRQKVETTLHMKNKGEEKNLISVLNSGVGVCRHFSRALSFILTEVGVKSEVLDRNSGVDGHSFNRVICDGETSYIDSTWLWRDLNNGECTNWLMSPSFLSSKTTFGHASYLADKDTEGVDVCFDEESILKTIKGWKESFKLKKCDIEDLINKRTYKKINDSLEKVGVIK